MVQPPSVAPPLTKTTDEQEMYITILGNELYKAKTECNRLSRTNKYMGAEIRGLEAAAKEHHVAMEKALSMCANKVHEIRELKRELDAFRAGVEQENDSHQSSDGAREDGDDTSSRNDDDDTDASEGRAVRNAELQTETGI